ncbi:MAG: dTDP-4-dehydrorhamnose reductase [Phycisphaerae bacterium]|nr:dTDP-4-dehydrorhamnose reductase [Phycisphaerae bacterium]
MTRHPLPDQPVLLLGSTGMLGRALARTLASRGVPFTPLTRAQCDLSNPESAARALQPGPRVVVNAAAWTDVDGAEADEAAATLVNAEGPGALARRCADIGATLVTYGTDYVFDGRASAPYRVDHPRRPLNAYGRSKARGEELIERSPAAWLNLRTSWLYAPWGRNFVRTIAAAARVRPTLKVVNDQRGRPTSAEHLARATLALLERDARGTFHVTDGGECTWFDFAVEIVRRTGRGAHGAVEPCSTAEFPRPAPRPAYSVLDLRATEALLGPMPDWRDNLADVLRRLEP